jgi:D-apionolactonase
LEQLHLTCDVPFLPLKFLKAGEVSCYYEAGNLRYIKWGSTELIRMIYSAVRDEHWDTVPMIISNEKITERADGFSITYHAAYRSGMIDYVAEIKIEGYINSISFNMKGEALSSFKKNRIGLCVLHPLEECMEKKAQIMQPDGSMIASYFPKLISPHQPFKNIREIQWSTATGVTIKIRFEGDIFETEDQRNWTDASYKTYGTPLDIPFPADVERGEKMHQVITLNSAALASGASLVSPAFSEERIRFPDTGFSLEPGTMPLDKEALTLFRGVPILHYQVSLELFEEGWKDDLKVAAIEAEMLQTRLQLVCTVDHNFEMQLEALMLSLEDIHQLISSLLPINYHQGMTTVELSDYTYRKLKASFPLIAVGYGTNGNFAELNRNRPPENNFDFVRFSLYPQAHANDNRTIIENLESHLHNIATMKSFANSRQLHVSVSFDNPRSRVPDERQQSVFAAYWQLMCLQGLAEADSITFCSLSGLRGLFKNDLHPSPFYDLLKKIKSFDPRWIVRRFSNKQLIIDGLLLENISAERLWIKMDEILSRCIPVSPASTS